MERDGQRLPIARAKLRALLKPTPPHGAGSSERLWFSAPTMGSPSTVVTGGREGAAPRDWVTARPSASTVRPPEGNDRRAGRARWEIVGRSTRSRASACSWLWRRHQRSPRCRWICAGSASGQRARSSSPLRQAAHREALAKIARRQRRGPGDGNQIALRRRPAAAPILRRGQARSRAARPGAGHSARCNGRADITIWPGGTIHRRDCAATPTTTAWRIAKRAGEGFRLLGRHRRRLSHYVRDGDALDGAARAAEGISVCLPRRLTAATTCEGAVGRTSCARRSWLVDRLCMVCDMAITAEGGIIGQEYRLAP